MSSLAHRYHELGADMVDGSPEASIEEDALEDIQLASFDAGYKAGWEDSAKAQTNSAQNAAVDVVQSLQDMSFTHRDAYLKLNAAMRPLLEKIVDSLLPLAARDMLGVHLVDQLGAMMDAHAEQSIEIAIHPDNIDRVSELLADVTHVPFALVAEPTLGAGQAYMRAASGEVEELQTQVRTEEADAFPQ